MSISHKFSQNQMFRLMVYKRALHPELFELQGRRIHQQSAYEVETWVVASGHALRFQVEDVCITEAVLENSDHLPETGLVYALPCLGEKEYELPSDCKIGYVATVQTEALTDNLYSATYREMRSFGLERNSLLHAWTDAEGTSCLSLIDSQKYKSEFHVQTYHLLGNSGIVLRTQSIFERLNGPA